MFCGPDSAKPQRNRAPHSVPHLRCFWLDHATGSLKPAGGADVGAAPASPRDPPRRLETETPLGPNPAFILQHPTEKDVVYASTERIDEDGSVYSLRLARDAAGRGGEVADASSLQSQQDSENGDRGVQVQGDAEAEASDLMFMM